MKVVIAMGYKDPKASFTLDRGTWGWGAYDWDSKTIDALIALCIEQGYQCKILKDVSPDKVKWYDAEQVQWWTTSAYRHLREIPSQYLSHHLRVLGVEDDKVITWAYWPEKFVIERDFIYLDDLAENVAYDLVNIPYPVEYRRGMEATVVAGCIPPPNVVVNSCPSAWYRMIECHSDGWSLIRDPVAERAIIKALKTMARRMAEGLVDPTIKTS